MAASLRSPLPFPAAFRRSRAVVHASSSSSAVSSAPKARFVARRSESTSVQQLARPLAEYMSLPASQYSVLDAERIERVDESTFRCYVYRFRFFTLEVCPVLLVRVDEEPDGCCIRLLSCKLEGSPLVEAQNDKFSAENFSCGENIELDRTYPHDPQLRLEPVKFPCMETVAEVEGISGISDYLCSEIEAGQNDEAIQLVEDILEEFGDEEERDFSYLLDILIASGIHGTEEDQLYKVCQSLDCPASYDVFEKLEKKYMKVSQWSRSDRKLIFDMVNSILSEILAPCLDMHPWVNTARNLVPMWGPEGLLEKVLQMLAQRREELALSKPKPEKKAFDQKWPDLADCIDKAGRDVEKMIKDDLLEELLLELMSS